MARDDSDGGLAAMLDRLANTRAAAQREAVAQGLSAEQIDEFERSLDALLIKGSVFQDAPPRRRPRRLRIDDRPGLIVIGQPVEPEYQDEVYQPTAKQLHIRPLVLGVLSAVGFLTAGLSWTVAAGLAATTLFAAVEGKHLGRGPAYDGRQGQILYEMYLLTHNGRDDDFPRDELLVNVNLSRVKARQPPMTADEFERALAPLLGRLLDEKQDGKILSWADLVIAV